MFRLAAISVIAAAAVLTASAVQACTLPPKYFEYVEMKRPVPSWLTDMNARIAGGEAVDQAAEIFAHAEQGDAVAWIMAGEIHEHGLCGPVDYAAARNYYRRATQSRHAETIFLGHLFLGNMLERGQGGPADAEQAEHNYRRALSTMTIFAVEFSVMTLDVFTQGRHGTTPLLTRQSAWLRQQLSDPDSALKLAESFGTTTPADALMTCETLYNTEPKNAEIEYRLSALLLENSWLQNNRAAAWYHMYFGAVKKRHPAAMTAVGRMLLQPAPDIPQPKTALVWWIHMQAEGYSVDPADLARTRAMLSPQEIEEAEYFSQIATSLSLPAELRIQLIDKEVYKHPTCAISD